MMFSNFKIFLAELIGTFGLLVAATGSIVFDASYGGTLGPVFVALMHFIGLAVLIYGFGKYSLAHFNPAVTLGFFISGYTKRSQLPIYFAAQLIGAFLGSFFVKYVLGDFANLGLNFPNLSYSLGIIYAVEIVATVFLMAGILVVVHFKKLNILSGVVVGGIIALDVFFLGPVSGASMNPIRSLSPAIISGNLVDLWLYWSAPFIGVILVGLFYKWKRKSEIKN